MQYLIIGSGRTARHFVHYFQLLGLPFELWNRHETQTQFQLSLKKATHVLLLISDSAIESFFREHLSQFPGKVVHFSGSLEIPGVHSAHPLMTFAQELYSLEDYQVIPFVSTSPLAFQDLLPGLANPAFKIKPEQKAFYHALCVLSGNFTTLLWQKMNSGMKDLGLPEGVHLPYMKQIFKNLEQNPSGALTGPLARKDLKTVLANDKSLTGDPIQNIYRAFVKTYFPEAIDQIEGAQ